MAGAGQGVCAHVHAGWGQCPELARVPSPLQLGLPSSPHPGLKRAIPCLTAMAFLLLFSQAWDLASLPAPTSPINSFTATPRKATISPAARLSNRANRRWGCPRPQVAGRRLPIRRGAHARAQLSQPVRSPPSSGGEGRSQGLPPSCSGLPQNSEFRAPGRLGCGGGGLSWAQEPLAPLGA